MSLFLFAGSGKAVSRNNCLLSSIGGVAFRVSVPVQPLEKCAAYSCFAEAARVSKSRSRQSVCQSLRFADSTRKSSDGSD